MTDEESAFPRKVCPEWQHEYQAALMELEHGKLLARIIAAETAIFKRLQSILLSSDHQAERQAIEDALSGLRVLKRDAGLKKD